MTLPGKSRNQLATFVNASDSAPPIRLARPFRNPHRLSTRFRNHSTFWYAHTTPAVSAASAPTTRKIGLADIAAFSSHCAAAINLVAASVAIVATRWATSAAVWRAVFAADTSAALPHAASCTTAFFSADATPVIGDLIFNAAWNALVSRADDFRISASALKFETPIVAATSDTAEIVELSPLIAAPTVRATSRPTIADL